MNGTPPALSARFCVVRLPFDLSEEELYYPPDELERVINKLDKDGWNTSQETHRSTFNRAFILMNDVREDILDASLSVDADIPPSRIE